MRGQLLEWMRNPVTNEHIADVEGLGCGSPAVPEDENICNGIPVNMVRRVAGFRLALSTMCDA